MSLKLKALETAFGVLLIGLPVFAQSSADSLPGALSGREGRVIWFIHQVNDDEIDASTLAQQKTQSDAVKNFANQMIADHQAAEQQVRAYASSHGINLDTLRDQLVQREKNLLEDERRSKTVGSATGEWAFTWENTLRSRDQVRQELDKLQKLDGAAFDREFIRATIDGHQQAVDRLNKAKNRGLSPDLGELIDALLPTVRHHLEMARALRGAVAKA
jgi:putative membrane protein